MRAEVTFFPVCGRMSAERTGYGTYEFLDQSHMETVKKGCYWTTIPNKGTEIRLTLTIGHDTNRGRS
jgi:hypothetical protein